MAKKNQITVSVRIDRTTRDLLEQAAKLDHRSMSNLVEVLILRHCDANGITATGKPKSETKKT